MSSRPKCLILFGLMVISLMGAFHAQEAVGPTAREQLDSLLPDETKVAEFEVLLDQLGSEKFKERKAAMEKLLEAPLIPGKVLERGLESDDPEIAGRTREIVERGGAERSEKVFKEALATIEAEGTKGLLGKVVDVMESGVGLDDARLAERVAALTAVPGDAELLERLAQDHRELRRRMAGAAGEVLEGEGTALLNTLLDDEVSAVRIRAAITMSNLGMLDGARALAGFLDSEDTSERMQAWNGLRAVTGKEFGYQPLDPPAKRAEAVGKWKTWLQGDVALSGRIEPLKAISLFNGKDLTGWKHFRRGVAVDPKAATWTVEDGILVCPGQGPGDLRTEAEFENYALTVVYRAKNPNADGGLGIMFSRKDPQPGAPQRAFRMDGGDYLEVQLLPNRSGDLYIIGNFKAQANGREIGFSQRRSVDVPEPLNQWHEMRLEVRGDQLKVILNGKVVNEAVGRKGPGNILLREERFRLEFKEITLLPLGG